MKQCAGIWLPDHEQHLVGWILNDRHAEQVDGKGTYQFHKLKLALGYCRSFRTAVDVGAHVGLWSMHLAKRFDRLFAFEPIEEHRRCFVKNLSDLPDDVLMEPMLGFRTTGEPPCAVALLPCALGAAPGRVALTTRPTSSGDTFVSGPGDIEMRTLDSFDLQDVDFLKIDCEGYELEVLKGAVDTLERCKPVVVVEQKEKNLKNNFGIAGIPAVDFLRDLGARCRGAISGDWFMTWDKG